LPGLRRAHLCRALPLHLRAPVCDHCGAENPETSVRAVQTRDIFVRFVTAGGCSVQAVDLNLDRRLGPRVPVTSPETLRRLLIYLGALPEALREFDRSRQSHGKGNVRITLEPARKNLPRLRNWEIEPDRKAARLTSPKS
jgi:hypothetical protein